MKYRDTKLMKIISIFMVILLLNQVFYPAYVLALSGGPSQPEMKGFTPIGASDMVDLFTGDFSYNIPLMDVGGYPINLAYQANPRMDDEASWVGLGWSLNPGVLVRNLRGLPDDFDGEPMTKSFNMRENNTYGGSLGASAEFGGFFGVGASIGLYHNSYKGWGETFGISPTIHTGKTQSPFSASVGVGLNFDSQKGVDISPSVSIGARKTSDKMSTKLGLGLSTSINSRGGLKQLSYSISLSRSVNGGEKLRNPKDKEDKRKISTGASSSTRTGGSFDFSGFTYFPSSGMPINSKSFTFNGTIGTDFVPAHPNGRITGWGSEQSFRTHTITNNAYGYLYTDQINLGGEEDPTGIYDYNREDRGAFRMDMPTLPFIFGTYDLFSATGQGISGQFRAARNDIGAMRKPNNFTVSTSKSLGIEVGIGNAFHVGTDIDGSKTEAGSQSWLEANELRKVIPFVGENSGFTGSGLYEAAYFKATGEPVPLRSGSGFYAQLGQDQPVAANLVGLGSITGTTRRIGGLPLNGVQKQPNRTKRNTLFSFLTGAEASKIALDKQIENYTWNSFDEECKPKLLERPENGQMSEVKVTKKDGSRYVYGIPAMNISQTEYSFSVNAVSATDGSLCSFVEGDENTDANHSGRDHFFQSQGIPPYAHSFLLTAILSPDYVDRTGDGITDDDLGSATKINYSKVNDSYHWRAPLRTDKAKFQEGYKSMNDDQKASYVEGIKELWYLHSIESKTMIAEFIISEREHDGRSTDGDKMFQLDKIKLFSKSDLNTDASNAIPIKTVHFEYNNNLCKGIPKGDGKLTLKRLWFTYGNNDHGVLNPYQFSYEDENDSKTYNAGDYDRWGLYQKNPSSYPNNIDFPYTIQNKTLADINSSAWCLSRISLPSGGTIYVEYESDDYAYVQNKRAGQMTAINGFASTVGGSILSTLYQPGINAPRRYLVIQVDSDENLEIGNSTNREELILKKYLGGVDKLFPEIGKGQLYFKALVDLDSKQHEDYVFGYLDIDISKSRVVGDKLFIYTEFTRGSQDVLLHPITKAALQLLRMNIPDLAYETPVNSSLGVGDFIKAIANMGEELRSMRIGYDRTKIERNWSNFVKTANHSSWVRLDNPTFKKYGGGSRVKTITVADSWQEMSGGETLVIGQKYDYTVDGNTAFEPQKISSGVASYEPLLGGDEISLRQPMSYVQNVNLAPDQFFYAEKPVGESLYPSPVVGYSSVRVTALNNDAIPYLGTGYSVSEFYTAKDFPVIAEFTPLSNNIREIDEKDRGVFKSTMYHNVTASQGYLIEVNDMHGKPKKDVVYNQGGDPISSKEYFYQTDRPGHLSNDVVVMEPAGKVNNSDFEIGREVDVWTEMQEERTHVEDEGNSIGFDFGFYGFFPIPWPSYWSKWSVSDEILRTAVTTKLIKRFGILNSIKVVENGSSVTTKNLIYDSETGDVLLTETQNEFEDPIYNFTYPAHWAYDGMGQAYKNQGIQFGEIGGTDVVEFVAGEPVSNGNVMANLIDGDELLVEIASGFKRCHVLVSGNKGIIDENGNPIEGDVSFLKVIRSGRKNMPSSPIGSVVSLENPLQENTVAFDLSKPVSTSAVTYSDDWRTVCDVKVAGESQHYFDLGIVNPFLEGLKGNFRPNTSYVYYDGRTQVLTDENHLNNHGEIDINATSSSPNAHSFWEIIGGQWQPSPHANWVGSNVITEYDLQGNEIENKDPLNISSSALFGYNNSKVVAIAQNSPIKEIANDNFEDYRFHDLCGENIGNSTSFKLTNGNLDDEKSNMRLTDKEAHTGLFSLMVINDGDDACFYNVDCEAPCDETLDFSYQLEDCVQAIASQPSCDVDMDDNLNYVVTCPHSCGFYDSGGSDNSYDSFEDYTFVVKPSSGQEKIKAVFSSWSFGEGSILKILDDDIVVGTLENSGSNLTIVSESDNGELKFVFHSAGETGDGWEAILSCETPPTTTCCYLFQPEIVGSVASYNWTFGNIYTSTYSSPLVFFEDGWSGEVTLIVEMENGCIYSKTQTIQVNCVPENTSISVPDIQGGSSLFSPYTLECVDCLPVFKPIEDGEKSYMLSIWVASDNSLACNQEIYDVESLVKIDGATGFKLLTKSPVIDGWQQLNYGFSFDEANGYCVRLSSLGISPAYFDDFRFHPVDANMKAYVYDPMSLRLMAELDENNYATFYEYDDEGNLIRIKRETDEGIKTIQESRTVLKK